MASQSFAPSFLPSFVPPRGWRACRMKDTLARHTRRTPTFGWHVGSSRSVALSTVTELSSARPSRASARAASAIAAPSVAAASPVSVASLVAATSLASRTKAIAIARSRSVRALCRGCSGATSRAAASSSTRAAPERSLASERRTRETCRQARTSGASSCVAPQAGHRRSARWAARPSPSSSSSSSSSSSPAPR